MPIDARFALVFAVALVAGLLLARLAPALGLLDHPGGRKDHADATPLVGGLAIFCAMLVAGAIGNLGEAYHVMLLAGGVLVLTGIVDDRHEIGPLPRFVLQAVAALVMAFGANVVLHGVGRLIGFYAITFGVFAIPATIFCVLGVINSINMIDGLDGLSGSISATIFATYAYVAHESGLAAQAQILAMLLAATLGFLVLNMRLPWQSRARIFLGDTGSMLLGLLIAWFAIDLTMGDGRTFPPICALWVVMVPLCDCVSLMARRRRAGRSALVADREHLHHYLRNRGLSVAATQWTIALANAVCALFAVVGWQHGMPEPVFFAAFVVLFVAYHVLMGRAFAGHGA